MEFDLNKRYCYYFNELAKIPRGSRNEKEASDWVCEFAKAHGLTYKQDHVWNVYIEKPATPGYENADPLILQAHLDMVCEKNKGVDHDFEKDPLDLYVDENGWLRARGTTLGCDDGYGVAYMLAILESDDIPHPALQCWFTTMEEVGLLGAMQIKAEDLHAHQMINLDGGGELETAVSSAGGVNVVIKKKIDYEPNTENTYAIRVRGLKGGHSGGLIHLELGNSIIIAATILKEAELEGHPVQLVSFDGGLKYNAIPREADVVFTAAEDADALKAELDKKAAEIATQLEFSDPDFRLEFEKLDTAEQRMTKQCSEDILNFVYLIPNGFQHKSMAIEGLTLASSNLGVVVTKDGEFRGDVLARSAIESYSESNGWRMHVLAELCHMQADVTDRIFCWNYAAESRLRDIYADVLKKQGKELITQATHGGLETGVFKGLVPDMDIICCGPVAEGAHTPEERLDLASFDRAWDILLAIIAACK